MSGANFVQLLLSGLAMGAIYALTANGLFIAHLATTRMNFGQGEFLMFAAYLSMALLLAGVPVAAGRRRVIVVLALMGWGLERFAIRPLDRLRSLAGGQYSWVLTTMGVALIMQNVVTLRVGQVVPVLPAAVLRQSPERRAVLRRRGVRRGTAGDRRGAGRDPDSSTPSCIARGRGARSMRSPSVRRPRRCSASTSAARWCSCSSWRRCSPRSPACSSDRS